MSSKKDYQEEKNIPFYLYNHKILTSLTIEYILKMATTFTLICQYIILLGNNVYSNIHIDTLFLFQKLMNSVGSPNKTLLIHL